jgi:hypothetical protein
VTVGEVALASFELSWNTVDGGGGMVISGGSFTLSGTIGQVDAGFMSGGVFTLVGGFWATAVTAVVSPGDCDQDGDVDLSDHAGLADCLAGPDGGLAFPSCECFDLDASGDVDLLDFAEFQVIIGLPGR